MPDNGSPLPLPPTPPQDSPSRVYVINSDPGFLEMIGDLVSDARLAVTLEQMRPNIDVSLDNLRLAQPDLLILDVIPYRHDAELLLSRMAEDSALRRLPVMLASTSPGLAEQLANTYSDLVRDVLPKPFNIDDFYLLLKRLIVGVYVP